MDKGRKFKKSPTKPKYTNLGVKKVVYLEACETQEQRSDGLSIRFLLPQALLIHEGEDGRVPLKKVFERIHVILEQETVFFGVESNPRFQGGGPTHSLNVVEFSERKKERRPSQ